MPQASIPTSQKTTPPVQPPQTIKSFQSFQLHPELLKSVERMGFEIPTPIQSSSIPPALHGRDLLACAMTGSGKTAAFLLPIMHRIMGTRREESRQGRNRHVTRALVLSPTRELAAQIRDHALELAPGTSIQAAAVFGGVGMEPQIAAFRHGVDIIIATPGRLLDHFQNAYAALSDLEYLVLDEADRMLDMGFLPDVRKVLAHLPSRPRQTLFFSATMPQPIVELSRDMLKNPVAINIERVSAPATGISQTAFPVPESLKTKLLIEILKREGIRNAIAFTRTKHRANRLSQMLTKNGIQCACIHGNRSQLQRTAALGDFKAGKFQVLVATDIAARGIDIEALSHVINFDVPHLADDYIHRVGRTARASLQGEAFTFVSPDEEPDFREIERRVGRKVPRRMIEGFDYRGRAEEALEIPIAQRIAAIRAKRAEDRARAAAKVASRAARQEAEAARKTTTPVRAPRPVVRQNPPRQDRRPAQAHANASPSGSDRRPRPSQGNDRGSQGKPRPAAPSSPSRQPQNPSGKRRVPSWFDR